MARVILGLIGLLVPGSIGYCVGRFTRKPPEDPRVLALREHARLIDQAADASKDGQQGKAEILERAAYQALETLNPKELGR